MASLRILDEIGLQVLGDRALDALGAAGARADRATRMVRLDPAQVESLVAKAPREFRLHARNPERDVLFGGNNLVFCAVGGPAFVSDLDRGRRPGNFADFVDYVRLIGALDVLHQEGGTPDFEASPERLTSRRAQLVRQRTRVSSRPRAGAHESGSRGSH